MATEKWIAGSGQGLTWGAAMGSSDPNSLASGNAILSSQQIDNSAAYDVFADLSVSLGSVTPGAGAPYIGFYLYPLNEDGSSYGDGRFGSAAAGPPPSQYYVGSIPCVPSTAGVITGAIRGIILPPGKFKFVLYNLAGGALAASSNAVDYRTYNRSVA
jgi:hypothetical protein